MIIIGNGSSSNKKSEAYMGAMTPSVDHLSMLNDLNLESCSSEPVNSSISCKLFSDSVRDVKLRSERCAAFQSSPSSCIGDNQLSGTSRFRFRSQQDLDHNKIQIQALVPTLLDLCSLQARPARNRRVRLNIYVFTKHDHK